MRFGYNSKILGKALCVWALSSSPLPAQDISSTLEHGPWISSKPYLVENKPTFAETTIPFVSMMKTALIKGLNNAEQHQAVLKLQSESGTRPKEYGHGYLGPNRLLSNHDANSTHGTRWTLFRNAKTYAGKEIRFDFVPESFKRGLRFDPTAPDPTVPVMITGTPLTYGLILRNIEPASQELRIASVHGDDYQYFQNAPKAIVQYDIGPIAVTQVPARAYSFEAPAEVPAQAFQWTSLIPDYRFRGKFSPRGLPTAAKPLPDQTLSLEQVQGYYSTDIQFVNGFQKESVVHRLRLPIYDRLNVYEEFDESFKPTKIVISDYFYKGAFSTNLEHNVLEKRYRAGFFYKKNLSSLELYAHLPDTALNASYARQQRWELSLVTSH